MDEPSWSTIAPGSRPASLWERSIRQAVGQQRSERDTGTRRMPIPPRSRRAPKNGYVSGGMAERLSFLLRQERDRHVQWMQRPPSSSSSSRDYGALWKDGEEETFDPIEIQQILSPAVDQAGASTIALCSSPSWSGLEGTAQLCVFLDLLLSTDSSVTRIAPGQRWYVHEPRWTVDLGAEKSALYLFTRITHLPSSAR